jgi:positive regulator of sigma E activity
MDFELCNHCGATIKQGSRCQCQIPERSGLITKRLLLYVISFSIFLVFFLAVFQQFGFIALSICVVTLLLAFVFLVFWGCRGK